MVAGVVVTDLKGQQIRLRQFRLFRELAGNRGGQDREIDIEEKGERSDIDDVFQELAQARVGEGGVAQFGQRDADDDNIFTAAGLRQVFGRIKEKIAAGQDLVVILHQGLAVDGHGEIRAAASSDITLVVDPDLIPGRQALDIRGKDIFRTDRYPHAVDGQGKEVVGAGRTGAVDIGKADDEIVDAFYPVHESPASAA